MLRTTIALLALFLFCFSSAKAQCYPVPNAAQDQQALNNFWHMRVPLCQIPPGSNNAFADKQHGVVWADQSWLDDMASNFGPWAATGILAHEWGHLIQGPGRGTAMELQADCLAGVFLKGADLPWQTVEQFASANFMAGDNEMSFGGHGSHLQRVTAARRGYYGFSGQSINQLALLCPASAF